MNFAADFVEHDAEKTDIVDLFLAGVKTARAVVPNLAIRTEMTGLARVRRSRLWEDGQETGFIRLRASNRSRRPRPAGPPPPCSMTTTGTIVCRRKSVGAWTV